MDQSHALYAEEALKLAQIGHSRVPVEKEELCASAVTAAIPATAELHLVEALTSAKVDDSSIQGGTEGLDTSVVHSTASLASTGEEAPGFADPARASFPYSPQVEPRFSGVDVSIQTDMSSPDRKSISTSLLYESPQALQIAQRCQKKSTPGVMPSQSPWSALDTTAPMNTTVDFLESPRTDAGSESTSVATTVAPRELRFRGKWSEKLDIETRRIARIMRGCRENGEESDGSSSTGSD
jgi:hypothetical protein